MRLAKLELLAFGHFRGHALDFDAPGLHVVLGRNEAGKSTTLRAITGLFYGIDRMTPDAHVHKPTELRIGGVVESSDGQRLRFVRRKGNANTLADAQDKPIDETVLRRFLGGVTRETFEHAYGLDHDTLAEGAKALLDGRGDLGESLFDAGVGGGGGVQQLVAALAAEADLIFKPKASAPMLNEALKSYAEAAKKIKETQRLPESFTTQIEGRAKEVLYGAEAATKKKALEQRRSRLVRAANRAPHERARAHLLQLRAELGAVAQNVGRIEALEQRFVVYERDREQLRKEQGEVERLRDRLIESKRRAALAAELDTLRDHARVEERVKPLLKERTKLTTQLAAAEHEIAKVERALARLTGAAPAAAEARVGDGPPALDREALVAALEGARALGGVTERVATETTRLSRAQAQLTTRAGALFDGTLEACVALRVPALASVQALETRAADLSRRQTRADERRAELERDAAKHEREIAARAGDFAPPDATTLQAARAARDSAWDALRKAEARARADAEIALDRLLRDADVVADRMIAEADRVTALARLRSEQLTNREQLGKIAIDAAAIAADRAALDAESATLFDSAGVAPRALPEMAPWLVKHGQLVVDHARFVEEQAALEAEVARAGRSEADLAAAVGVTKTKLPELIIAARTRLEAVDEARRAADAATSKIAEHRATLDDRVAARDRDAKALADVSARVAALVAPLGLEASSSDEDVNRTLGELREVFEQASKLADAEARAKQLAGSIAELERDIVTAARAIAPAFELADARALFDQGRRARDVNDKLAKVDEVLASLGEPDALDDADRALVADVDACETTTQALTDEIDQLDSEVKQSERRIGGIDNGLEAMRKESNAAEAAAAAQHHLARVREGAERWARVKLASVILGREIERYREENQGPLLAKSSLLFAQLTLGAYAGIKAGFDDKDKPCLRCVRKDGAEVDVAGLSDGTRDQLYLSLRLASLLRRAEVAEPMPLILDDVLIQLDDERAAAALSVLAEVSKTMQILFFTHHARLVELAKSAVPASDLVVHSLVSPVAAFELQVQ